MRTLVVSSYPPRRCGIGAYARDQVARLRGGGEDVSVLSPHDGDGDVRAEFIGGAAFRRAAAAGASFDRIVVHFQPALYFPPRRPVGKVFTAASLLWLVLRRRSRVELVMHEADRPASLWRPDYALLRLAFLAARRLDFHTEAEVRAFERDYRLRLGSRTALVPHAASVSTGAIREGRKRAREHLGIADAGRPVLVCVGFVQPSKGFDRALEAFSRVFASADDGGRGAPDRDGSLYLVGSVRDDTPENRAYIRALRSRADEVRGAHLVERFVPDDEFDLWIAAADRVVLPYRRSWSSGVLARAHELGVPAIVSDVGGLSEQAGAADVVAEGDDGLVKAFEALRSGAGRAAGPGPEREAVR
jgi:glycosyltransferase involved in cell wall biosynthesis